MNEDCISREDLLKELSVVQNRPVSTAMKIIRGMPNVVQLKQDDCISIAEAQTEIMLSKGVVNIDGECWIKVTDATQALRELLIRKSE